MIVSNQSMLVIIGREDNDMRRIIMTGFLIFLIACQQTSQNEPDLNKNPTNQTCEQKVTFTDANLERAIKQQLELSEDQIIRCEQLVTLKVLDISQQSITNLTGLENAVRLIQLNAQQNQLSSISPLAKLKDLHILDLGDNHIKDISALSELSQLKELYLWQNQIEVLNPLSKLINLEQLNLWNNQVNSLDPLSNLIKLKNLDLSRNKLNTIGPLLDNTGLGSQTQINLVLNLLDLSEDSEVTKNLKILESRGIQVKVDPQQGTESAPTPEPIPKPPVCVEPLNIPDGELFAALLYTLGLPYDGVLSCEKLDAITQISSFPSVYRGRYGSLEGIQNVVNLETFYAGDSFFDDISPLSTSYKLKNLSIADNTIDSLEPIAKLNNLRRLNVGRTQVDDYTVLQNLKGLEWLSLRDNSISDISFLQHLDQVTFLDLSKNPISDISTLLEMNGLNTVGAKIDLTKNFLDINSGSEAKRIIDTLISKGVEVLYEPQLKPGKYAACDSSKLDEDFKYYFKNDFLDYANESFYDTETSCFDIVSLSGYTRLDFSDWYTNHPEKVKGFADALIYAANLEYLSLPESNLTNLDFIVELQSLKELRIVGGKFNELAPLSKLTQLEKLAFVDSTLTKLNPLSEMTGLKAFHYFTKYGLENKLSDISFLASLKNLESLVIQDAAVFAIEPLAQLNKLKDLSLKGNIIETLTPLADLNKLETLSLESNNIKQIDALLQLPKLIYLSLKSNEIENIDGLAQLTNLTILKLGLNKISNVDALAELGKLETLELYRNKLTDISNLNTLTNLTSLSLAGNQIEEVGRLGVLSQLRSLDLSHNQVKSVEGLESIEEIEDLDLSYNDEFGDLSPLVKNTSLGSGDKLYLWQTNLDLSKGSQTIADLWTLHNRGVVLHYSRD